MAKGKDGIEDEKKREWKRKMEYGRERALSQGPWGGGGGGYEASRGRLLKGCKNTRIKLPQLVQIGILDELQYTV
jgi:hypothetical protein